MFENSFMMAAGLFRCRHTSNADYGNAADPIVVSVGIPRRESRSWCGLQDVIVVLFFFSSVSVSEVPAVGPVGCRSWVGCVLLYRPQKP